MVQTANGWDLIEGLFFWPRVCEQSPYQNCQFSEMLFFEYLPKD
jgi:hypothetical protein